MPLTVDSFLGQLPDLVALRSARDNANPDSRERQRLLRAIYDREQQARQHWTAGTEGWMTADEGIIVAAGLNCDAVELGRVARAQVRETDLVFTGGAHGEHRLALTSCSPVRAAAHWKGYLEACPLAQPTSRPDDDSLPARQLDLGELLGVPTKRRPRERSRMLSIPLPRRES